MGKVYIPLRLSKEDALLLEEEAKREGVGKSVLARRLLRKALRELRIERAIEEYKECKCSLGYAAEMAGLSIRDFISELIKRNILIQYSLEDLEEDLKAAEEYG